LSSVTPISLFARMSPITSVSGVTRLSCITRLSLLSGHPLVALWSGRSRRALRCRCRWLWGCLAAVKN
jgi:hypothetical protein